jgi:UDP-3-O-[3-hydroxymyristoyl] glucosamine N-acyltransferase
VSRDGLITTADIAAVLGDDVLEVLGDGDASFSRVAPITEAGPGSATFCSASGESAVEQISTTQASVVVCHDLPEIRARDWKATLILTSTPRFAFLRLVRAFFSPPRPQGIDPTAVIHSNAQLGSDVYIGPLCSVGESQIGDRTVLYSHVSVGSGTRIGQNVTIYPGTVIGASGFGYHRREDGVLEGFPHIGGVVIEDDVEIGSNTSIDRGTLGDTIIKAGARIDNLVHIAHNVVVGRNAAIVAHAMIGGSTLIDDRAYVAPGALLRDVISIGADAMVGLGALVVKDVPPGVTVMGVPARPAEEYKALLRRLSDLTHEQAT